MSAVTGCGAPVGGPSLAGVDVEKEAVVQGVVTRGTGTEAVPVGNAYVRLLDRDGEFTAEVPTSDEGQFRFFASPGTWTLRTLAPGVEPVDLSVVAQRGAVAEVTVSL